MASRGWAGINELFAAWLLQLRWPLVDVRSGNTMQHVCKTGIFGPRSTETLKVDEVALVLDGRLHRRPHPRPF
ncbi:hypothetical protein C8035_v010948 [Colletotrichum spinosum]|uniref:Uncharacterized protein n=1 Tax=Colletotrichum spinosum TaxID=1347390 RepID=A0A4R8Q5H3_9PEZI|nr:hypothetical protein C8035_v010948 [Colletotrichum spinosum]